MITDLEIRTYSDHDYNSTLKKFNKDAQVLAKQGFTPASQMWVEPARHGFLAKLFAYGLLGRPNGTLTVYYQRVRA